MHFPEMSHLKKYEHKGGRLTTANRKQKKRKTIKKYKMVNLQDKSPF